MKKTRNKVYKLLELTDKQRKTYHNKQDKIKERLIKEI